MKPRLLILDEPCADWNQRRGNISAIPPTPARAAPTLVLVTHHGGNHAGVFARAGAEEGAFWRGKQPPPDLYRRRSRRVSSDGWSVFLEGRPKRGVVFENWTFRQSG
jgi:hypothetical protein